MHNHDDKYPARPRFAPGTPRLLQDPVDTNEPSGPATITSRPILHRGRKNDLEGGPIIYIPSHVVFL